MKILVAYDGSPGAEAAVDEVIRRPWPPRTEVRLVTVLELPMVAPPGGEIELYGPLAERLRASLREVYYQRIQRALDKFKARPDLRTSYDLREPGVKYSLLEAIREWGADLVMMGSQGTTALGRLFLGSVCHALVSQAPCNIEIIRTPKAA